MTDNNPNLNTPPVINLSPVAIINRALGFLGDRLITSYDNPETPSGKLMVNKKTWYAHLHQDGNKRGYPENKQETEKTYKWTADYWLQNSWEGRIHDFEWFINKFYPMPTWPENWKELYGEYIKLYT